MPATIKTILLIAALALAACSPVTATSESPCAVHGTQTSMLAAPCPNGNC
jgi:hypothetical protein